VRGIRADGKNPFLTIYFKYKATGLGYDPSREHGLLAFFSIPILFRTLPGRNPPSDPAFRRAFLSPPRIRQSAANHARRHSSLNSGRVFADPALSLAA
jgi:hypothetical protein